MTKTNAALIALFVAWGLLAISTSKPALSSEPPMLKVVSLSCDPNHGRPRADLTVQNVGRDLLFAQAYISFGGKVFDSFLLPTSLPSGSIATTTVYGNNGDSADCSLLAIQDRYGRAAKLN